MTSDVFIGIISYFPDNAYRNERIARCQALIAKCDELFGLPIVAIAQNWQGEVASANMTALAFPKLGITSARKTLWEYFKHSAHEWMICFDDDCELQGTREDGQRLIGFLRSQTGGYFCGKKNEFKLFALHRSLARMQDVPDLDVGKGTGIEDLGYFELLRRRFPGLALAYDTGTLQETSNWANDPTSTWHRRGIAELLRKTTDYVERELK